MIKKIGIGIASLLLVTTFTANAVTDSNYALLNAQNSPAIDSKSLILQIIHLKAKEYGVSEEVMVKVIACESQFNPNAINDTSREYSVGLVQINLLAHKSISKEEAKDPYFAITFLAKNLSQNKGNMWTCYRNL